MTKHGTILLVEEHSGALLTRRAFEEADIHNPVQVVHSGEEAVKYLSGQGKFGDRTAHPMPSLVLLDLTMPGEGGFVALRWLYERPGLRKKFTLIALGAANADTEVQLAYELGAQSYLVKPADLKQWVATARRVKEYWIELNLQLENAA